jgi:hypothetical protein
LRSPSSAVSYDAAEGHTNAEGSQMKKKVLGILLVLAVLAFAAYSGYEDGRDHQSESAQPR